MDYASFKAEVIARAQALGIAEYELYYHTVENITVSAFGHGLDQFSAATEGGICFRCVVNGKMGYAATEELSPEQAHSIVERAVDNASVLEADEPVFLVSPGQSYTPTGRDVKPMPETKQLIDKVLQTQEALYATHPSITDGSTTRGIAQHSRIAIYNAKGLDLSTENAITALIVGAVVAEGEEKSNDYQIKVADLEAMDTAALCQKVTEGALAKLGGEPAPTGVYPVVFHPEAMSDLLATFSDVFSSENAQKGLSRLADMEGKPVASAAVTIVDDPFHPENPMPMPFDSEGSPTRKKNLVEKGTLNTLLYNLKTAALAGKETTGNAAKANYDSPVAILPFTMYLSPGEFTEEQLLQQAGTGVYIHSLAGLHAGANAITGDFSLQSEGYLIENGKKTAHVKGFTVAGNFYQLLKDITAVADNLQLPAPTGTTAFGSPSVLVQNLSVAGK